MHPQAKVILVWPSDVIPIGDARGPGGGPAGWDGRSSGPFGFLDDEPSAAVLTLPAATADRRGGPTHGLAGPDGLARVLAGPGLPRTTLDELLIVDREPAPLLIPAGRPAIDEDA
ncbi:MAG: hypothetical protein U0V56_06475 [Actinomycetota bacterium]